MNEKICKENKTSLPELRTRKAPHYFDSGRKFELLIRTYSRSFELNGRKFLACSFI